MENFDQLPEEVQAILNKYNDLDNDYQVLEEMKSELNAIGWTFDYYLDAVPADFRRIEQD
jgi:hypothetical protein